MWKGENGQKQFISTGMNANKANKRRHDKHPSQLLRKKCMNFFPVNGHQKHLTQL